MTTDDREQIRETRRGDRADRGNRRDTMTNDRETMETVKRRTEGGGGEEWDGRKKL